MLTNLPVLLKMHFILCRDILAQCGEMFSSLADMSGADKLPNIARDVLVHTLQQIR